jgi:hypothetical protein
VIKSSRRWVGFVARMKKKDKLVPGCSGWEYLEDLDVDVKIILKWITRD